VRWIVPSILAIRLTSTFKKVTMNTNNNDCAAMTFGWNRATTLANPSVLGMRFYSRRAILLRFVGVLALLSMLLGSTQSFAWSPSTQVQGRLIGQGFHGPMPVPGLIVTLYNRQLGRSGRAVSRPDGTFYFGSVPLGPYLVEVWFRNNPYPRTFRVFVNQMPFANIGTFQLGMPQVAGGGGVYGPWSQSGF
jgi:hypothetical protein